MQKKNVTLILLLSALAILLLSLQNPQYSNLFLYVALGISVLSAEITFLPDEVLAKRLQVPNLYKVKNALYSLALLIKNTFTLLVKILDWIGGLTKLTLKFVGKTFYLSLSKLSRSTISFKRKVVKSLKLLPKTISQRTPKLKVKKALVSKKTKKVVVAEEKITHKDEESWGELIVWWVKTPILPSSLYEWALCVLFVLLVTLYVYIVLDRFFSGHNGLDMFAIWSDVI